jgi:nucleoside-diphosphate-sugar epimerase
MAAASPWWIVGAGYTGQRLAAALLAAGERVDVTRRGDAAAAALGAALGCPARGVDLDRPATVAGACPPGATAVLLSPPAAVPSGERALIAELARAGARRLVYVSSTGVYPPGDGGWVDEEVAPAPPPGGHGARRLAAERALATPAVELAILRAAAIYGPGRGVHARLRAGTYRVLGAGDGWVSRIHVDDLVAAIVAAGRAAPLPHAVVNAADDAPTTSRQHGDEVAALLGLPPPPSIEPAAASPEARAMLGANRRIDNRRLKALLAPAGLRYPTWREGTLAALAEEARSSAAGG